MNVSKADRERILPHLAGWHTLPTWMKTQPSEADLWIAFYLEKTGPARPRLMNRLLARAQKLQRIREVGADELKYGR